MAAPDWDHDGTTGTADCDQLDPAVHPGAVDQPDQAFEDTNCDRIDGDGGDAIFVAPTGSDVGTGTSSNPFATIQKGIDVAKAQAKDVYVAGGSFSGISLPSDADGTGIYGGYTPGSWARGDETTTITGSPQAALLNGATRIVLGRVTLVGNPDLVGRSAYGARAINASSLALVGSTVRAAKGLSGFNGVTSGQTTRGDDGADALDVTDCHSNTLGAGGGGTSFGGFSGSSGGQGGAAGTGEFTWASQAGFDGTNIPSGASGGDGGGTEVSDVDGGRGDDGARGADGLSAGGGGNTLDLASTAWSGASGGDGTDGGLGRGGAGGGGGGGRGAPDHASAGGGGGGGGGGGQGGIAGTAGGPGGGSFAVYLHESQLVTRAGSLTAGTGGPGGSGGDFGAGGGGGTGGTGGSPLSFAACENTGGHGGRGGAGGAGGNGGRGGGGAGGPSAAIFRAGATSASETHEGTATNAGTPGGGGQFGGAQTGRSGTELGSPSTGAADFDGDGVNDAADACPEAPRGASGGANGCPARGAKLPDGDHDGVPNDGRDECPTMAVSAGNDANADGCPDLSPDPEPIPPVTTTTTSTTTTGTTGGRGVLTVIAATVTNRWLAFPKFTVVRNLSVNNLPAGATVKVTCKAGREACPYKRRTVTTTFARAKLNLLKPFNEKRLPIRTKITITITAPGTIGKVVTFKVRKRAVPSVTTLCLSGGRAAKCV